MRLSTRLRKDLVAIVTDGSPTYDDQSGVWTPGAETTLWSGLGSVQPYVRTSTNALANIIGGIALDINAFIALLPYEALTAGQTGFRIKVGSTYYVPQREPLDDTGQHVQWIVVCSQQR